ncbi:hypothetical protein ACTA71_000485 [Dictyostelium dimigraforme]
MLKKLINGPLLKASIETVQIRYFSIEVKNSEPIKNTIIEKLTHQLKPIHLDVVNESYMHSVPRGSETHFKVIIVSDIFNGKSIVAQHRLVNDTLKNEMKNGVHALSIHCSTPDKWDESTILSSPGCMGGSKKEKQQKQKDENNNK